MTLSRHGLDSMTGGIDDPVSVSFGFVNSILKIINNMIGLVPKIRELPGGKTIIGPDGRFVGAAGFVAYKIIGIDNTGGLLGFAQKIYSGKFTTAEILNMINPVRITNVSIILVNLSIELNLNDYKLIGGGPSREETSGN